MFFSRFILAGYQLVTRLLYLLFFGLVLANPVCSQVIQVTDTMRSYSVEPYTEFVESQVLPAQLSTLNKSFRPLELGQLQTGTENQRFYWFRFTVSNQTHSRLYALLDRINIPRAQLFVWENGQARLIGEGGLNARPSQQSFPNNRSCFYLEVDYGQTRTFYLYTTGLWLGQLPLLIYPVEALLAQSQTYDLKEGFLSGILFCSFIFSLIFYLLTWQKDYLWQSIFLILSLLQSLVGRGIVAGYVDLPPAYDSTRILFMLIPLTGIASLQFQRTFLRVHRNGNALIRKGYLFSIIGYLFLFGVGYLRKVDLFEWQTSFTPCVYVFGLWANLYIWRKGFAPARFLLIAQILPVPFVVWMSLNYNGYLLVDIQLLSMLILIIQNLLYSLTVGYKVKSHRDKTLKAIRLQNQSFEKQVEKRTWDLRWEKNRADQQSTLLKLALSELNHRVKNNLAVISSLLQLESKRLDAQQNSQAFRESQQRIEAISLIHRQLNLSQGRLEIDLAAYLTDLASQVLYAYGFDPNILALHTPDRPVTIRTDLAVSLGLLLNEVFTNACKYGLPFAQKPNLKVIIEEPSPEQVRITVQDNGRGIDLRQWDSPLQSSIGKRLIQGFCQQLQAEFLLENQCGTRCSFTIPLDPQPNSSYEFTGA